MPPAASQLTVASWCGAVSCLAVDLSAPFPFLRAKRPHLTPGMGSSSMSLTSRCRRLIAAAGNDDEAAWPDCRSIADAWRLGGGEAAACVPLLVWRLGPRRACSPRNTADSWCPCDKSAGLCWALQCGGVRARGTHEGWSIWFRPVGKLATGNSAEHQSWQQRVGRCSAAKLMLYAALGAAATDEATFLQSTRFGRGLT